MGNAFFLILTFAYVSAVLAISHVASRSDLAVYSLSFWQYLVYALAFLLRSISLEDFKQDAFLLKTISLLALGYVLLQTGLNPASLIVMAIGFGLNISAVSALGPNRTYYGVELGRMPVERIHRFPYSLIPHPMLIGNMLAYGALLIDSDFRIDWWPLAIFHVTLNLTILLMEAYGGQSRFHGILWSFICLISASLLFLICFTKIWHFAIATALVNLFFGGVLVRRYAGRRAT